MLLILAAVVVNRPDKIDSSQQIKQTRDSSETFTSPADLPGLNQDGESTSKDSGNAVCGNDMCEPDLGESKENCPKDCSAGD